MNGMNVENPLVNVCVWLSRLDISGVCAKAFLPLWISFRAPVRVNLRASIRDANPYGSSS